MTNGNSKRVWPVRTVYFNGKKEPVKTNLSRHPIRAMGHCTVHLASDKYGASAAEIIDVEDSAQPLYAAYKRTATQLICTVKRDLSKYPLPERYKKGSKK